MISVEKDSLQQQMESFLSRFRQLNKAFELNDQSYSEMEETIGQYTAFIVHPDHEAAWGAMPEQTMHFKELAEDLRQEACHCVWAMEKHRARAWLENRPDIADYFHNIEDCIEAEFQGAGMNKHSKVLMIGSGAFPMTPLLIQRRTGAQVVGIDIDAEANRLAVQVLQKLECREIQIEQLTVDQLSFTREATHIIFASTIPEKFDLLQQLHDLTNPDVIIAMRYGNGLKSLFNYPLLEVSPALWTLSEQVRQPGQVFETALYRKSAAVTAFSSARGEFHGSC
ncbi:hypothetical protein E6C60_2223 [Paenibacillus algicola]|uniref:Uncharacterized protein n=1 Tax=Paenibacillus algicola TaxID=2565926 RepID=A0A4P8XJW2_9BACL|nr:nicotianamine synthase family protein [Paenibacillus algicola]QCT02936.1 hypothetical protein E6C60_2223 [Paenibacillus algicola]